VSNEGKMRRLERENERLRELGERSVKAHNGTINELRESKAENERLRYERDIARAENGELNAEVERLRRNPEAQDAVENYIADLKQDRDHLRAEVESLRARALDAESALIKQRREYAAYMDRLTNAEAEVERLRAANEKNKAYVLELEAEVAGLDRVLREGVE
jgi:chromosome segregation ATPase